LQEEFRLPRLPLVELLYGSKVPEVFIVCIYLYLMCRAAKVRSLLLKGLNDRHQLFIINRVIKLGSYEFL